MKDNENKKITEIIELAETLSQDGCTNKMCQQMGTKGIEACNYCKAAALYRANYRKQSNTVKEFIEKVKAKFQELRETLIYPETEEDEAYDQGCNYGLDFAIEEMQNIAKLFYNDGTYGDCNDCEMRAKNKEDDQ